MIQFIYFIGGDSMEWAGSGRNTLSLDLMLCQGATFCDTVYDMQPCSIFTTV
jgi:hypothetical protein